MLSSYLTSCPRSLRTSILDPRGIALSQAIVVTLYARSVLSNSLSRLIALPSVESTTLRRKSPLRALLSIRLSIYTAVPTDSDYRAASRFAQIIIFRAVVQTIQLLTSVRLFFVNIYSGVTYSRIPFSAAYLSNKFPLYSFLLSSLYTTTVYPSFFRRRQYFLILVAATLL